jgi:hypothetical protein
VGFLFQPSLLSISNLEKSLSVVGYCCFAPERKPRTLPQMSNAWIENHDGQLRIRCRHNGTRRNQTKTGRSRLVFCNPAFQELLRSLHSERKPKKSDLLFSTPKGLPIDDHRFRRRGWRKVLELVGVAYRGLYCRHSSISLAAHSGANLIELSEQTGHSKRTMIKTYLHAVEKKHYFWSFKKCQTTKN